jgi:ribosomal protein S24E
MELKEFLDNNPSRKEVAEMLCKASNFYCLPINELWCYKELCDKYTLDVDDFYDDQDELTEYERKYIGIYNWKVKTKE